MFLYFKHLFSMKCPRCHEGELFVNKWYRVFSGNKMVKQCSVCGQRTELEPGFYHGTGYISYMVTVALTVTSFVTWSLITGYGFRDKEIFYWLPVHIVFLIMLQPWLMRLSRVLWLTIFFHNDDKFHQGSACENASAKN